MDFTPRAVLNDFHSIRPPFIREQNDLLEWLAQIITRAEKQKHREEDFDDEMTLKRMRKYLARFACGATNIFSRGTEIAEGGNFDFSKTGIYRIEEPIAGTLERTDFFARAANRVLSEFYQNIENPPGHLVHVTCTGYVSPSAAQVLINQKSWNEKTSVTHAYHMGCYASMPAVRLATGLLASEKKKVDIVHTEICSLHLNPWEHTPEQLVIDSLFSDGHIKYSLQDALSEQNGLELLEMKEYIIPNTENFMAWRTGDQGMKMSLSKDVPGKVVEALPGFLDKLLGKEESSMRKSAIFAIHPGGPKIIDSVQNALELNSNQVIHSREILFNFGNMSSATLPHIWKLILEDEKVLDGRLIVSLAFGPGLTIFGALFRKRMRAS